MPRQRNGFVADAFFQIAVAGDHIGFVAANLAHVPHGAIFDDDLGHLLAAALISRFDGNPLVNRVRQQPPLSGLDGIHDALSGKGVVFQDVERSGIQSFGAGVLQPHRA